MRFLQELLEMSWLWRWRSLLMLWHVVAIISVWKTTAFKNMHWWCNIQTCRFSFLPFWAPKPNRRSKIWRKLSIITIKVNWHLGAWRGFFPKVILGQLILNNLWELNYIWVRNRRADETFSNPRKATIRSRNTHWQDGHLNWIWGRVRCLYVWQVSTH